MDDAFGWQLRMYIVSLLGSLPWLLVMLTGGVVCLARLSTRPREGWLVGGAIALSLFATFGVSNIMSLLIQYVPGLTASFSTGANSMWMYQLLFGLPSSIIQAAAWGLILYAAFGPGSGPRSKYLIEEESPHDKSA